MFASSKKKISVVVSKLQKCGIIVSLFVDPNLNQIRSAAETGADFIELHTGVYAQLFSRRFQSALKDLEKAAVYAHSLGLRVNAGHGLNYENVKPVAALPYMEELNIGHSIIARTVFVGMRNAVREMVKLIHQAKSR